MLKNLPIELTGVEVLSSQGEGHVIAGHIDIYVETALLVLGLKLHMLNSTPAGLPCDEI